jgi:hypothetical protein
MVHPDRTLLLHQARRPIRPIGQELDVSSPTVEHLLRAGQEPLADYLLPEAPPIASPADS